MVGQLVGLKAEPCADLKTFLAVSNTGRAARATAATSANSTSSRSHAAMLLRLVDTKEAGKEEVGGSF